MCESDDADWPQKHTISLVITSAPAETFIKRKYAAHEAAPKTEDGAQMAVA
jgi:hypothetical protein